MYIEEIELGPHFITFYTKDLKGIRSLCQDIYTHVIEKYPLLAPFNPNKFEHVDNDPRIYHRFGEPNNWRDAYRHFHINTCREPDVSTLPYIIEIMKNQGCTFDKVIKITDFNNKKLNQSDTYPPRKDNETYLSYLERLRKS